MARLVIELPYPPSLNHYWRRVGVRTLISRQGRAYRQLVLALVRRRLPGPRPILHGRVSVRLLVHPPDDRSRRDLDNLQKALFDALQMAAVFEDDGQIDHIEVDRGAVVPGGVVIVELSELESTARTPMPSAVPP